MSVEMFHEMMISIHGQSSEELTLFHQNFTPVTVVHVIASGTSVLFYVLFYVMTCERCVEIFLKAVMFNKSLMLNIYIIYISRQNLQLYDDVYIGICQIF